MYYSDPAYEREPYELSHSEIAGFSAWQKGNDCRVRNDYENPCDENCENCWEDYTEQCEEGYLNYNADLWADARLDRAEARLD